MKTKELIEIALDWDRGMSTEIARRLNETFNALHKIKHSLNHKEAKRIAQQTLLDIEPELEYMTHERFKLQKDKS